MKEFAANEARLKKLMVVDDEFIVRVGIRGIVNWEEHGYTMTADASSGEEALEKIALYHPDIVLADLKMENMDGFELMRRCAAEFPQLRFIVLSSHNEYEDVRKAMKLGAKDYLFKPTLNREELLRVIDEVSGKKESDHGSLDTVIRENLQAIRFNLLRKWAARSISKEDALVQFRTLAPRVDPAEPFFILYISIDDFEKQGIHGDTQFLKTSTENIIGQITNRERAEIFTYEKGDIAVFINCSGKKETPPEDLFRKIREYCRRYVGLDVSGTVSPVITEAETVPDTIKICEDTLRQRKCAAELWPYNMGQRNEIARAREFIARHLSERVGVQEIAAAAGMSESHFSRLFKKETGSGVVDYINRVKIEKAVSLLDDPRAKVADIAEQMGFDNPNYFSTIFKKIMGLSPHDYRINSGKSKIDPEK